MKTGNLEANLVNLNSVFKLSYLNDLITIKTSGKEKGTIDDERLGFFEKEYLKLLGELETAGIESTLPNATEAKAGLHNLLLRIRLK